MSVSPEDLAKRFLRREWAHLNADERHVIEAVLAHATVTRDPDRYAEDRTLGQRAADRIASFGGSWTFILLFMLFLVVWTTTNTMMFRAGREAFDPYPYIFLNLILSMLAALQAPIIMMSQNRQAQRDRLDAQNDYRVNLMAEMQIRAVHEKLDELREARWSELIELQREQLRLLAKQDAAASQR